MQIFCDEIDKRFAKEGRTFIILSGDDNYTFLGGAVAFTCCTERELHLSQQNKFADKILMEEADKENLLIPELDEDIRSQSEDINEDKRDDKVTWSWLDFSKLTINC